MKVTVVYREKVLEVDLPEEQIRQLETLSPNERRNEIEKIAVRHLKKHGDKLGFCIQKKEYIDTRECLDCSLQQGNKKVSVWELCKTKNLKPTEYR